VHIDDVVFTEYTPTPITTTNMPDPELRAVISDTFGKPFGEITDMDALTLDELNINVDDYSVSDLTGLELFSGLTHLSFDDTVIADYSVIAELNNLRNISLDNTQVSDVSFLSNLTGLTSLDLDNNQIASLANLSELSHVTYLSVRSNPLSINELTVIPTYFPDLWALRISNTYDLGGGIHPIDLTSDFSALLDMLDDLSMLEYLSLNDFYFSDIQFSSLYTQVLEPRKLEWTRLYIEDSELTEASLSAIATLENLERLWLSANAITDLSALTNLVNLSELGIAENEFTDLSPLQTLYENGAFANGGEIEIENCGLNLTSGTPNRNVVDFLINAGIDVIYLEGNTIN
jgi:internalin A